MPNKKIRSLIFCNVLFGQYNKCYTLAINNKNKQNPLYSIPNINCTINRLNLFFKILFFSLSFILKIKLLIYQITTQQQITLVLPSHLSLKEGSYQKLYLNILSSWKQTQQQKDINSILKSLIPQSQNATFIILPHPPPLWSSLFPSMAPHPFLLIQKHLHGIIQLSYDLILVLLMQGQLSTNNSASPKKQQPISTQTIFKYVNAVLILILLYCIPGFLNFREYAQQKGWYVFSTDSLIWCAAGFFGIFIIKYSYYYFMKPTLNSILSEKYQGEDRVYKLNSILKLSLDTIFYSFVSIMAYLFFRNEEWFPSVAGGAGSCSNMYKSYPNWPSKSQYRLEIYYMIQLGVHIFSVFEMIVIKRGKERKYYEYLLHHSVAASLILFSMMCNQTPSGGMTLIVHDFSDIFLAFGRFFVQTKYCTKNLIAAIYVITTTIWIYMRIIVFPFCILSNVYINKPTPTDQWHIISFQYSYLLSMAIVLYGMHIFWTYFIIRIGLRSLAGKKMSNIHEETKNKAK